MGLVGADVDQLRALARAMTQAADRLDGVTTSVSSQLTSTRWVGQDFEQYRSQWQSESGGLVRSASTALRAAAAALERNAADQEQASGGTGGAITGGVADATPGGLTGLPGASNATPGNPLVNIRDFLNTTPVWPVMWSTLLGPVDKVSAIPVLDALGLVSDPTLSPHEKATEALHSVTDFAGGALKSKYGTAYLAGLALQQWGDVAALAAQADFSPSGVKTVTDYIAADPGDAFEAARDAVIGYVPKLVANLVPW